MTERTNSEKAKYWAKFSFNAWFAFASIYYFSLKYLDLSKEESIVLYIASWLPLVIFPICMFFLRVLQDYLDNEKTNPAIKIIMVAIIALSFGTLLIIPLVYLYFYYWSVIRKDDKPSPQEKSNKITLRFLGGLIGLASIASVIFAEHSSKEPIQLVLISIGPLFIHYALTGRTPKVMQSTTSPATNHERPAE